ncbi:MAG: TolC family protein, partial [Polyangia bacterium]
MWRKAAMQLAVVAGGVFPAVQPAAAKTYTLPQLVEMARRENPGVQAGGAATAAMESQLTEAKRNWFPSGELTSFVAPVPRIQCRGPNQQPAPGVTDQATDCVSTDADPLHNPSIITNLKGLWTRTELRLVQPIWDFGKISAGVSAAEAGVEALRARQSGTAYDVELNVKKAYWGLKLAREVQDALAEGIGYISEAQTKLDKELEKGT